VNPSPTTRRATLRTEEHQGLLTCLDAALRGEIVRLLFTERAVAPGPIWFRVRDPQGRLIVDRLLRELPTLAHGPANILQIPCEAPGDYAIQMQPLPTPAGADKGMGADGSPAIPVAGASVVLSVT
jgi:hypothetical protein